MDVTAFFPWLFGLHLLVTMYLVGLLFFSFFSLARFFKKDRQVILSCSHIIVSQLPLTSSFHMLSPYRLVSSSTISLAFCFLHSLDSLFYIQDSSCFPNLARTPITLSLARGIFPSPCVCFMRSSRCSVQNSLRITQI